MRRPATAVATAALLVALLPTPPAGATLSPGPADTVLPTTSYRDPPFDCRFHHYGEGEQPRPSEMNRDPLCVEYEKRDITVTNGGAVRFALAEPMRVAVALPACRYWQKDHWRVQVSPGDESVLRWDGSYWFHKARRTAGGALYGFRLAGEPVSAARAADLVRPVSPQVADAIERYGVRGGMGMSLAQIGPREQAACSRPGG